MTTKRKSPPDGTRRTPKVVLVSTEDRMKHTPAGVSRQHGILAACLHIEGTQQDRSAFGLGGAR